MRLAAAALVGAASATALLWTSPRAPLAAGVLLACGLALAPAPAAPPWALVAAGLALAGLVAATPETDRTSTLGASLAFAGVGIALGVVLGLLLPRLSLGATTLVLLATGLAALALGAAVAFARHAGEEHTTADAE